MLKLWQKEGIRNVYTNRYDMRLTIVALLQVAGQDIKVARWTLRRIGLSRLHDGSHEGPYVKLKC